MRSILMQRTIFLNSLAMATSKTILLIGTFDTKEAELIYVRDLIQERGHRVLLMDAGVLKDPLVKPDFSAALLAEAGGVSLGQLRVQADRGKAMDVMIQGVRTLTREAFAEGRFDGVIGVGGGGGTNLATAGMRELPVGVPKVMVSTVASADVRPYVDIKDITLMYSVLDIAGLNRISMRVLANAAGAVCGMVEQGVPDREEKPVLAATMFGVTTPCITHLRGVLEKAGFEVLVFHATGSGGRAMEGLIQDGYIAGVADMTTTEWCDELVGGVLSAGPDRLNAAAEAGIPQVVSCGALDMVNFHAMQTVPEKFADRLFYKHNPNVTLMRTTAAENAMLGEIIAEKLNRSTGPVTLMLPLKGVSMIDAPGQPFYDPKADEALFGALRNTVQAHVQLVEMDVHINDPTFAEAAAAHLLKELNAT